MPSLKTFLLRGLVLVGALSLWFLTQGLLGDRPPVEAIGDLMHDATVVAHGKLIARPESTRRLLIISSLGIDLIGLTLLGWGFLGRSMRPMIGLFSLFALRQVAQATTALPSPPGKIWFDPEIPSLFVTYAVGNDFFFSGHTALVVFGALELSRLRRLPVTMAVTLLCIGEILLVLVFRAHYTLDVITGAVMAYAVWMTLNRWWPQPKTGGLISSAL
jgi:hypothetical protein